MMRMSVLPRVVIRLLAHVMIRALGIDDPFVKIIATRFDSNCEGCTSSTWATNALASQACSFSIVELLHSSCRGFRPSLAMWPLTSQL
ncbi:hypothetical protein HanIR_Chr02g0051421 [Helianthus annuus]|nr:hypothetical protein HanIR_Chr02g0051421 [Helianthus annuus]